MDRHEGRGPRWHLHMAGQALGSALSRTIKLPSVTPPGRGQCAGPKTELQTQGRSGAYPRLLGLSDPKSLVTYGKHHIVVVFHVPVAFFLELSHLRPFCPGEVPGNVLESVFDLEERDSV